MQNKRMVELPAAAEGRGHRRTVLTTVLDTIPHGVIVLNHRRQVILCTKRAIELLDLPLQFSTPPYPLSALAAHLAETRTPETLAQDDAPPEEAGTVFRCPDGRHIRLTPHLSSQGGTLIIEDISSQVRRERAKQQAESEYRSLFENAVYGIYRDRLDGTPVRANPALAALNGYTTEAEHIAAVTSDPNNWYVDPGRVAEFHRLMQTEGRVKDLVSEVYRHKTRERMWITENAWYVRDQDGKPLFIEGTILDATERVVHQAAIERQANIDHLTGIANRFLFLRRLEEEAAPGKRGCVLFTIDLDRFKEVNDSVGHGAGDTILKVVAGRLKTIAGATGLVGRLGGDEFAMLDTGPDAKALAAEKAAFIVSALCEPIATADRILTIGASVGVAQFPEHAQNSKDLLRRSDVALYEVKSSGRNGWRIFDQELHKQLRRRKDLARELRQALEHSNFRLHYQPIMDTREKGIVGYEALLRWDSPSYGTISPDVFIGIAEEEGLMDSIGCWVISRACEDLALLPSHLRMGINVSPSQFRSGKLLQHVERTVERTGIDPARLVFEITETVLVSNAEATRELLEGLRKLGAHVALDDFGVGYSALSYLRRFPISMMKIDRSFIAGMTESKVNQAVIRAVMSIGRDLGIEVIAEGVETDPQVAALANQGCHLMQGYYFGKPVPLTEIVSDLAVRDLRLNEGPTNEADGLPSLKIAGL